MKRFLCIFLSAAMLFTAIPVNASTPEQEIDIISSSEEMADSELTGELIEITEDIAEESQEIAEELQEAAIDESMQESVEESTDFLEIVESKPALAAAVSGAFNVTASNGGDYGYTAGANGGVLTIKKNGTYEISMRSGVTTTTDRIKVNAGVTAVITIDNVKIDLSDRSHMPEATPGVLDNTGKGRPFDMKGAAVTLKLKNTNSFRAADGRTALFCPEGSTLVIEGTGSLTAETGAFYCVAAVGGEGVLDSDYQRQYSYGEITYQYNPNAFEEFVWQLQGYREWDAAGLDAKCGSVTIKSGTVNANAYVGHHEIIDDGIWDPYDAGYEAMIIRDGGGSPIVTAGNTAVAIGGANGGPIRIEGGTVNARSTTRSTTIGSTTNEFSGGIYITGGKVDAQNGYRVFGSIAMTDTGTDAVYGPAIGWASYSLVGDSNTVIEISGTANVTAKGTYGCAGIGGGRNGSGGHITIGGNAVVNATGGLKAAGIGGGIAHNPNKVNTSTGAAATMGTGTIIIKDNAKVTAKGGDDAAGIGGGGVRNTVTTTDPRNYYYPSEGQAGTIIIEGAAEVTATGGKNGAGIGSGGSDTGNDCYNSCQIQNLIITTTGVIKATGGANAANIGIGYLSNGTGAYGNVSNNNDGTRVTGVYVNTTDYQSTHPGMDKVPNSIIKDKDGNLVVSGTVDLTKTTVTNPVVTASKQNPNPVPKPPIENKLLPNAKDVSESIKSYLDKNSKAKIVSAPTSPSGTVPSLTIDSSVIIPKDKAQGVSLNGSTVATYTINLSVSGQGKVSIDGGNEATTAKKNVTSGTNITIKAIPADGWKFTKWSDNNTSASRNITVSSNTNLTAQFEVKKTDDSGTGNVPDEGKGPFTITLDAKGGTVNNNIKSIVTDNYGKITKEQLPIPVKKGYIFVNWYTNDNRLADQTTFTEDTTIIAMWRFDSSDDGENPSDIDVQGMKILTDADREGGYYYTGSAIKPKITIYDYDIEEGEERILVNGKDYSVKYVNNINVAYGEDGIMSLLRGGSIGTEMAGVITRDALYNPKQSATFFTDEELTQFNPQMPYIIISGKGNYEGYTYINFIINPALIADEDGNKKDDISINIDDDFASPKKDKAVIKSIKYKKALKVSNDYTAILVPTEDNQFNNSADSEIRSALNAGKVPANTYGEFKLEITGIKNYSGTLVLPVNVRSQNAISLSKVAVKFNKKSYKFEENGLDLELIEEDPVLADNNKDCFAIVLGNKYLTSEDVTAYVDDSKAGKGWITITPNSSDFYGKKVVPFNIEGTSISKAEIRIAGKELKNKSLGELPYKGEVYSYEEDILHQLNIVLMLDTEPLNYDEEYGVEFSKECNLPGTYTIKFVGIQENGYTGSLSCKLTIKKVDINSDYVTFSNEDKVSASAYEFVNEGVTEPGKDIARNKGILFNGEALVEGTDYTIKYKNNKIIGSTGDKQPYMTITGKGCFTGNRNIPFSIIPREINKTEADDVSYRMLSVVAKSVLYKESIKEYKPAITVKYDNVTLKKDKDYKVNYLNNSKEAVAAYRDNNNNPKPSVNIIFDGKYSGSINIPISIYDKVNTINTKTAAVVLSDDYSYDGKNIRPGYTMYFSTDAAVIKNLNALIKAKDKGQLDKFINEQRNSGSIIELEEDLDYYVSFGKNIFAGKNGGYLIFNGIGSTKSSYGGSIKIAFRIGGKKMINPVIDFFRNIF